MDEETQTLKEIRALIANMEANVHPDRLEALIACYELLGQALAQLRTGWVAEEGE